MNHLTEEEEMIRDLAVAHMKERGEEFKVTFIIGHGFDQTCLYFVMGHIMCRNCGGSHDREHLLYMRIGNGFVSVPERLMKRVADDPPQSDPLEIIKRLFKDGGNKGDL